MPAGHHTFGLSSGTATVSVLVWCATRSTGWLTAIPATVPDRVTCTAPAESLRTLVLTVRLAWLSEGTVSWVSTWVSRRARLALRCTTTSRTMPMLRSGGVCTQSIQPVVRFLLGSFGYTLKATELVPACSCPVTSNSWRGYMPAMSVCEATRVPLTQTSAAEMTPLKSSDVCSPVSVPRSRSARYHQGTVKSLAVAAFRLVE